MKDKVAVGADLYIEDLPTNINALRGENCQTIIFSNSTNRHMEGPRVDSWRDAERMVLERLVQSRSNEEIPPLTLAKTGCTIP